MCTFQQHPWTPLYLKMRPEEVSHSSLAIRLATATLSICTTDNYYRSCYSCSKAEARIVGAGSGAKGSHKLAAHWKGREVSSSKQRKSKIATVDHNTHENLSLARHIDTYIKVLVSFTQICHVLRDVKYAYIVNGLMTASCCEA